jgi:hypothetical protein
MAKQEIDIGVEGNDGTGDSIRESFRKTNENFQELYAVFGLGGNISFTTLNDTPDELIGSEGKVLLVKPDGTGIDFFDLVSNAGTNDATDPTNTVNFSISDGKLIVRAINTKVSSDPAPSIEAPLSVNAATAYNTTVQNLLNSDLNRSLLVDAWNTTHGVPNITEDNLLISKGFADLKYVNTTGDTMTGALNVPSGATGTQVPQIQEVVRKAGDTMTGPLTLYDHPFPYAGAGTPASQFDLQAATKYYVDASTSTSITNLFVATGGSDFSRDAPPGKQGRSEAYAFRTIQAACDRAALLQEASYPDIGPYVQPIQYIDSLVTLQSYVRNPSTYGYPTIGDQTITANTIETNLDSIVDDTIDFIDTNPAWVGFVYDERQFRNDFTLILNGIRLDIEASGGSPTVFNNTLTRFAALRYFATPEGLLAISENGQYTQTSGAITFAKTTTLAALTSAGVAGTWFNAVGALFDDVLDIIAGLSVSRVEAPNYYQLYVHSGPAKFTIQSGDPSLDNPNADIIPGKVIRGVTSGAIGRIISYTRGADTGGAPDYDTVEIELLTPDEFIENEKLEFGSFVKKDQITIRIESGIYDEQFPIRLPDNVSIKGDEFRRSIIRPAAGTSSSLYANTWFYRDAEIDGLTTASAGEGWYAEDDSSIRGYFGYHYLKDPNQPMNISNFGLSNTGNLDQAARLLEINKDFIIEETVEWVNATYPSLVYDEAKCRRDTGYIVDAIVSDLRTGGRAASVRVQGSYYGTVVEAETRPAIDHIWDIAEKVLINSSGDLYTPVLGSELQVVDADLTAETDSDTITEELINLISYAFESGYNPPKNNDEMDVFLCNDATIIRNVTCQRHGGFMMVLDPEGSVLTRSPYAQTCTSFSGSINTRRFAGGMFIDGYTYNMPMTIVDKDDNFTLYVEAPSTSGLGIRKPKMPASFFFFGRRYQVNAVRDYIADNGSGTASMTLLLDEGSDNGRGFDDVLDSAGGPLEMILQGAGNKSMLANDYTQINDLGYGVIANNNALSELVSVFTYYCHTGYYSRNGSQIRSLTGNNSYGNFGLVSEASDPDEVARDASLAQNLVQPAKMYVVDQELLVAGDQTGVVSIGDTVTQLQAATGETVSAKVVMVTYDGSTNSTIYVQNVTNGTFASVTGDAIGHTSGSLGDLQGLTNRGFTANENDVALYMFDLTDYPLNASEIEILHNSGLYQPYEVVSVTDTGEEIPAALISTLCDSTSTFRAKIWRFDLTSGVATADTGVQERTDFGTFAVYRAKQNFLFNGVTADVLTRPSTALVFDEYETYTYRTIAFENTIVSGIPVTGQQAKVTVDDNYSYVDLNINNTLGALALGGAGYTVDSTPVGVVPSVIGTTLGATQFDGNIAIARLESIDQARIVGMIFTWAGAVHRITGYSEATTTSGPGEAFGILTFEDVYTINDIDSSAGLAAPCISSIGDNIALKAGLESGEGASITVNISTCRATSHDFLDIGTGGYNTTNYPDRIYGAPTQLPVTDEESVDQFGFNSKAQVQERTRGRCFFASTDQDGFFRVGRFFTVDQGTGRVTFNAALVLTNIDGIGFKRGVRVNEFSPDATFTNATGDSVPTETAVEGYINARLGWDRDGDPVDPASIIGGGAIRKSGDTMTGNLNMGGNFIVNLASPTSGTDAANKNYVDSQIELYDTLAELNDTTITSPLTGEFLVYNGTTGRWVNEGFSNDPLISDVTLTFNPISGVASLNINAGAIVNADISATAAIAQSKLNLSDATAAATAGAATKGIASFDSANFETSSGWVGIKAGGISNDDLAGSIANSKLANSSITVGDGTSSTAIALGGSITFNGTANEVEVDEAAGIITFGLPTTINVDTTGNAATATTATTATNVAVTARNTNTSTHYLNFTASTNGNIGLFTDTGLTWVPTGNILSIVGTKTITLQGDTGNLLPSANAPTDSGQSIGSSTNRWNTVFATTFNGTATAATYADLAENYLGDADYEPGTVLVFGGDAEVTVTGIKGDRKVAGVVTTNPAHLMNSHLKGEHVVGVALQGRVPCKVLGRVEKGDILVTAAKSGYAIVDNDPKIGTVIGKAVGVKTDDGYGIVEVVVGRV